MTHQATKTIKGEKYIYLLMGYKLAIENNGHIMIGDDTGAVGSQNYMRTFTIQKYNGKTLIIEKRNNRAFADLSRVFEIYVWDDKERLPIIREYANESGENCSRVWNH